MKGIKPLRRTKVFMIGDKVRFKYTFNMGGSYKYGEGKIIDINDETEWPYIIEFYHENIVSETQRPADQLIMINNED